MARIEGRVLTLQDIRARFDSTRQPTDAQVQQYLRRWVADELLYREAVRRGINQTPEVTRRTEELRRDVIIQALLEEEIYSETTTNFSPQEIAEYYEEHRPEFTLAESMVLISTALFRDREKANSLRNLILREGATWNDALRDSSVRAGLIRTSDSVYYTEPALWPKELWRVATTIRPGSPSFPISTNAGYFIVQVWRVFSPGMPADLQSVESDIRNRLTLERRQRAYRSLVENLRSRYAVETYIAPSFGDTSMFSRTPNE